MNLHLEQALDNEAHAYEVAATGDQRGNYRLGWAVVALYYSALHYIDAYLEGVCGVKTSSHEEQDRAIAASPHLAGLGVLADYQALRLASVEARYRMRQFSYSEYEALVAGPFARCKVAALDGTSVAATCGLAPHGAALAVELHKEVEQWV